MQHEESLVRGVADGGEAQHAPPAPCHVSPRRVTLPALQTRIERQEAPHAGSASFDFAAANLFQSYVSSAIAFSIKRGGILYGTGVRGSRLSGLS